MTTLIATLLSLLRTERLSNEDGLEAVEYALIAALIAVAVTLAVTALGGQIATTFQTVTTTLQTAIN